MASRLYKESLRPTSLSTRVGVLLIDWPEPEMETAMLGGVGSGRGSSAPISVGDLGLGSYLHGSDPEGATYPLDRSPYPAWNSQAPARTMARAVGAPRGESRTGHHPGRTRLGPTYTWPRRSPVLRFKSSGYVGQHTKPSPGTLRACRPNGRTTTRAGGVKGRHGP